MPKFTLRNLVFVLGATAAAAAAVDKAMADGFTVLELVTVGCAALAAFAAKWPSDVTAAQAREIEARAKRESMLPPGDE